MCNNTSLFSNHIRKNNEQKREEEKQEKDKNYTNRNLRNIDYQYVIGHSSYIILLLLCEQKFTWLDNVVECEVICVCMHTA